MSIVLALDTCFNACSAALWPGEAREPVSRFEAMERGHAERIVPMIGELFFEAGVDIASLSQVIVTHGPGSFTGARIGIAAARALALSTGAKVSPMSSLRLMALTALAREPRLAGRPIAVAVDARREEVYFELFEAETLHSGGPQVLQAPAAAALLPRGTALLGSGGVPVAAAALADQDVEALFPELQGDARYSGASTHLLSGPDVRPLYLRPPDAKPQTAGVLPRTSP